MNKKAKQYALLYIEDNPLLLNIYRRGFEENNIKVYVAHDGDTGLKIAKKEKPGIILLDLSVHGLNGLEVLEKIKQDSEMRDIIVIVFTASANVEDQKKAISLGADEYLIKSMYSLDDVIEIVLKYFNKKL